MYEPSARTLKTNLCRTSLLAIMLLPSLPSLAHAADAAPGTAAVPAGRLLAPITGPGVWTIDLSPERWKHSNGGMNPSATSTPDGLSLYIANTPQQRNVALWNASTGNQDLDGYQYCLFTYRAENYGRGLDPGRSSAVVSLIGRDKEGKAATYVMMDLSKIWLDGREHTILVRKPLPAKAESVQINIDTDGSWGRITVKQLSFLKELPAVTGEVTIQNGWSAGLAGGAFKTISLDDRFNDSVRQAYTRQIDKDGAIYGGAFDVPAGNVTVDGMPFRTGDSAKNLIHAHEDSSGMNEKVTVFGGEVTRKQFRPIPRNDGITVPVNAKGSELFLLLQSEAPSSYSIGVTPIPFRWPDIESIAVRLNYADGGTDLAYPWSAHDRAFTIRRAFGGYAVPLDPKRVLKSVTLMNREWDKNVSLAALTLNTSPKQLFPTVWKAPAPVKVRKLAAPKPKAAYARRQGNSVTLGNTFYEVTADFSNGFVLKNLRNLANPNTAIRLAPDSGIALTVGDKTLSGTDFKVSNLSVNGATVTATLVARDAALPVTVDLKLTATKNEELQTNCTMNYTGGGKTALKFPYLKDMSIGSLKDTWYFFPHHGNALSNERGWYHSDNNQGFAVQFIDAYNSGEGVGVGLMTRNTGTALYSFGSSKSDAGVTQLIEYDTDHSALDYLKAKLTGTDANQLAAAETGSATTEPIKSVTTSLVFHSGDWQGSAKVYAKWLKTWYKPVHSQDKKWWDNTWLIGCLWASDQVSRRDIKVPPFYNPKTKQFYIEEANDADFKYLGSKPDGYHYFKQVHDDEHNYNLWNETAAGTYPRLGGLQNAQKMVKDFHKEKQFVSFYYIPDRYGLFSQLAQQYPKEKIAARDRNGQYLIWDGYFPNSLDTIAACSENPVWFDYLAKNTNKIIRDLNLDSVYLDVFPLHSTRCEATDHGHKVPPNPNAGTMDLLRRIRSLYPAKTAVWTEYQASDVSSQYLDGCLTYSATSTALILSPRWDEPENTPNLMKPEVDTARYLMPHYKQFCLPQSYGLGWFVMKQMLFNGKGLFGGGWAQWDTDVSKLLGDQTRLLRKYTDCFMSDHPENFVPTLRGDVYANKFPGKTRTLWTVMNTSGITIRDKVISVAHKPGTTYRDASTGKALPFTVKGNTATVTMTLAPQSVSCLVQNPKK